MGVWEEEEDMVHLHVGVGCLLLPCRSRPPGELPN